MHTAYDYLFLELEGGAAARQAFIDGLADRPATDEVLAV